MKKLLAVLVLSALLVSASTLAYVSMPKPFETQARAATGAIFVGAERRFECSGTEIAHTQDGDGVFLTARHCVADPDSNKINERMQVSFSDNQGGPFYDAQPVAISLTDDVALLLIRDGANLPEVRIRDERRLRGGDPIFNASFPLGTGKEVFHGEYMGPRFGAMLREIINQYPMWMSAAPMNLTIAHGSSGSGIFSSRERALIGVAVGTFSEGSYNIMIPADKVLDFLNDLKDATPEKFVAANPEKEVIELF